MLAALNTPAQLGLISSCLALHLRGSSSTLLCCNLLPTAAPATIHPPSSVGRIDQNMAFRGDKNSLIHSKKGRGGDSGFEALVYAAEKKMFYVVIEAVEAQRNPFHEAKIDHPSDSSPTAKAKKTNANEKAENEKSDKKQKQAADQRGARSDSDKDSYHAVIEELRMPFLFDNKKDKSEQKEEAYTSAKTTARLAPSASAGCAEQNSTTLPPQIARRAGRCHTSDPTLIILLGLVCCS